MKIHVASEREIIREAEDVLLQHMDPSKVARFFSAMQIGENRYDKQRKKIFKNKTVDSLYTKIQAFQEKKSVRA